jgi:hypothetical protein
VCVPEGPAPLANFGSKPAAATDAPVGLAPQDTREPGPIAEEDQQACVIDKK